MLSRKICLVGICLVGYADWAIALRTAYDDCNVDLIAFTPGLNPLLKFK